MQKHDNSYDYQWTPDPQYDGQKHVFTNTNFCTPEVVFGQTRYAPGGFCGPRTQKDYQLVLIYRGQCHVKLDETTLSLQPGIVYLFRPGHHEHFLFDRHDETFHFWCSITPKFLPTALKRRLNQSATSAPCSEMFQTFCTTSLTFGPVHSQNAREVVNSLGLALFAEYLRMANDTLEKSHRDEYANRAVHYMEKHYGSHDCATKSLETAGCSRNALIYKFRQQLGITPSRYLWNLRVEKGLTMLRQTGLTIAEISDRCGFKNPFHFSRSIRQIHGVSPKAIRQAVWK